MAGFETARSRLVLVYFLSQVIEQIATGILESISDAVVAIDSQWRYTYVNTRPSGSRPPTCGDAGPDALGDVTSTRPARLSI